MRSRHAGAHTPSNSARIPVRQGRRPNVGGHRKERLGRPDVYSGRSIDTPRNTRHPEPAAGSPAKRGHCRRFSLEAGDHQFRRGTGNILARSKLSRCRISSTISASKSRWMHTDSEKPAIGNGGSCRRTVSPSPDGVHIRSAGMSAGRRQKGLVWPPRGWQCAQVSDVEANGVKTEEPTPSGKGWPLLPA